jgi:hypothetical protein
VREGEGGHSSCLLQLFLLPGETRKYIICKKNLLVRLIEPSGVPYGDKMIRDSKS